jgi:hypothetical protein
VEEIVLCKGGDIGRRGEYGEMLAVKFGTKRNAVEVVRPRAMWRGCVDQE